MQVAVILIHQAVNSKRFFLKGSIFKKKGFCDKKVSWGQMGKFLMQKKGIFTACILK